nr:hypothetical protein [Paraburkholderia domus]
MDVSDVWLWSEWPSKFSGDLGIDLVAKEHNSGNYWAIQVQVLRSGHPDQQGRDRFVFVPLGQVVRDKRWRARFQRAPDRVHHRQVGKEC